MSNCMGRVIRSARFMSYIIWKETQRMYSYILDAVGGNHGSIAGIIC